VTTPDEALGEAEALGVAELVGVGLLLVLVSAAQAETIAKARAAMPTWMNLRWRASGGCIANS
jgi:hypothetical protein